MTLKEQVKEMINKIEFDIITGNLQEFSLEELLEFQNLLKGALKYEK